MNRREVLKGAALAAAAVTWPGWLREAFAEEAFSYIPVIDAYRRAKHAGKPLLVLIIPADDAIKGEVGHRLGELFNLASEDQLAPLALAEVVCATVAQVKALVPVPGEGKPAMLLIETAGAKPTIARVELELVKIEFRDGRVMQGPPSHVTEEAIDASVAQIAAAARQALIPDSKTVERRARQAERALGAQLPALLAALENPEGMTPHAADRAAALILARWGNAKPAIGALFRAAAARLRIEPVAGARWGRASGCGVSLVDRDGSARRGGCGMGYVPEKSARFLYFLTRPPE